MRRMKRLELGRFADLPQKRQLTCSDYITHCSNLSGEAIPISRRRPSDAYLFTDAYLYSIRRAPLLHKHFQRAVAID